MLDARDPGELLEHATLSEAALDRRVNSHWAGSVRHERAPGATRMPDFLFLRGLAGPAHYRDRITFRLHSNRETFPVSIDRLV